MTIKKPWLSIIIPVFNGEKYLAQCIESILCQTWKDFELIIVDDGSSDNSYRICEEYANKDYRIRLFHKKNKGSYQTRLYGAERARGEYVTFCDADDYYIHRKVFAIIKETVNKSNCSVLQFGFQKKYNHLRSRVTIVKNELLVSGDIFYNQEFPKLICSFWEDSHLTNSVFNKVYHRSLLDNLPSSNEAERAFWGDDLVMNLYLLEKVSSAIFLPKSLYVYRQGSGETNTFRIQTMYDLDFIKRHQLLFLEGRADRTILEKIMFSEMAGWLFQWVKQADGIIAEDDLKNEMERILQLPGFVSAQQYYKEHDSEKELPMELLRNAYIEEFVKNAKAEKVSEKHARKMKMMALTILKKIYRSI